MEKFRFNRLELAGSLGDLGTLLPLALAMILVNGVSTTGTFFAIGAFYILTGLYYGVTVPVQPMKTIAAYAIAVGMTAPQITASGLLIGVFLLFIGITGLVDWLARLTPRPVVRGVQVSVGVLLMVKGFELMTGLSPYQKLLGQAEPYLRVQSLGPLPVGLLLGCVTALLIFLLLDSKRVPAGLAAVGLGIAVGAVLGTHKGLADLNPGLYLPGLMPFGFPGAADFTVALFSLTLPQIPMTLGNAIIANADLSREYFGERAKQASHRALSNSMGLGNIFAFLVGSIPLCHGAGGLAAHYRFGARTAGSNLMIGAVFLALAVFFGSHLLAVINLLPLAVLGVLLIFAGLQLSLMIKDLREAREFFVVFAILGMTLAFKLSYAFIIGLGLAYALKWEKIRV